MFTELTWTYYLRQRPNQTRRPLKKGQEGKNLKCLLVCPRRSTSFRSELSKAHKKMPKYDGGDDADDDVEVLFELVGSVGREKAAAASDQLFKAPWREHRLRERERERERKKEGGVFLRSRERQRSLL